MVSSVYTLKDGHSAAQHRQKCGRVGIFFYNVTCIMAIIKK